MLQIDYLLVSVSQDPTIVTTRLFVGQCRSRTNYCYNQLDYSLVNVRQDPLLLQLNYFLVSVSQDPTIFTTRLFVGHCKSRSHCYYNSMISVGVHKLRLHWYITEGFPSQCKLSKRCYYIQRKTILSKNGTLLASSKDQKQKWAELFQGLLNWPHQ